MGLLSTIGSASGRAFGFTRSAIAAAVDAYFNLTTLLLNTSSTNGAQNNTFLDSSTNNFTITRNGNTTQGTFSPFSQTGWSNFFNGSSYLSTASNSAFGFSTNNFTIEGWIYFTSLSGTNVVFDSRVTSGSNGLALYTSGTTLNLSNPAGGTNPISTGSILSTNAWIHFALVRSGTSTNQTVLYINGVSQATGTVSGNFSNTAAYIANSISNEYLNGYISNFRVVNGSAVYASAFTPSTTPLAAITNTSLLTCQSNRFLDTSTNAFAITVNGTPSVQAFEPFAPGAEYSTSVVGGSGYFDGTGDYLSVASNANLTPGSSTYTFEFWFYRTTSGAMTIFLGDANPGFYVHINASNFLVLRSAFVADIITSSITMPVNAWTNVVIARGAANSTKMWINGSSANGGSATDSNTYAQAITYVGTYQGSSIYFTGYIAGMRFVKGSDVYGISNSTITVPTAPPTAVTNTQLLLNCTNSGIFDSTAKNVLETVGNAQVSTTQAKWGTTSMYFDGTGDYLTIPFGQNVLFGSGNFTIEGWVYAASTSARQSLFCSPTDGATFNGIELDINSGNFEITASVSSGTWTILFATAGAISATTWTHFALVRNGTNLTMYVNGTQTYTSTALGSNALVSGSTPATISLGRFGSDTRYLNGYIDDLRISKYARYTANFTAPTAAFPLQ